jgi:hypothetical protein
MQTKTLLWSKAINASFTDAQRSHNSRKRRASWIMILSLGFMLASLTLRANANDLEAVSIFLDNAQGILVNVTATTSYDPSNGEVTNSTTGALIGIVYSQYDPHIYSLSGMEIGLISTAD